MSGTLAALELLPPAPAVLSSAPLVDDDDDPPPVLAGASTEVTPGPPDENPAAGSPVQAAIVATISAGRRMALVIARRFPRVSRSSIPTKDEQMADEPTCAATSPSAPSRFLCSRAPASGPPRHFAFGFAAFFFLPLLAPGVVAGAESSSSGSERNSRSAASRSGSPVDAAGAA